MATHEAVAWITLENRDDSLHEFICTLFAALLTVVPGKATIQSGRSIAQMTLLRMYLALALSDELANPGRDLIIVLDDFHVIQSPEVHAFLADLVGHLPPQVHLVVLSRTDPPLPIGRLRAHDDLVEIRNPQLSFTREEQRAFLSLAFGVDPSVEARRQSINARRAGPLDCGSMSWRKRRGRRPRGRRRPRCRQHSMNLCMHANF